MHQHGLSVLRPIVFAFKLDDAVNKERFLETLLMRFANRDFKLYAKGVYTIILGKSF